MVIQNHNKTPSQIQLSERKGIKNSCEAEVFDGL
jgi:hypothetical protein